MHSFTGPSLPPSSPSSPSSPPSTLCKQAERLKRLSKGIQKDSASPNKGKIAFRLDKINRELSINSQSEASSALSSSWFWFWLLLILIVVDTERMWCGERCHQSFHSLVQHDLKRCVVKSTKDFIKIYFRCEFIIWSSTCSSSTCQYSFAWSESPSFSTFSLTPHFTSVWIGFFDSSSYAY